MLFVGLYMDTSIAANTNQLLKNIYIPLFKIVKKNSK